MSHHLETIEGRTAFISAHTMGWHQLGTLVDDAFDAETAMEHGLLGGWNVRKEPLFAQVGELQIPVPDRFAVVRDNPVKPSQIDILGDVGSSYQIVQNEQHAEFLNTLVDESGAHFDTAGSLYGGRQIFISMKLPGHIKVGGVDPVSNYITAINSHDGSMAFTLMVTPVRIQCANTLNLAFQNHSHIIRIRHTSGIHGHISTRARSALDISFKYLEGFQQEADQLINTELTMARFEQIIQAEFGVGEDASKSAITRSQNRIDEMTELFADAQTQDGIRGTAWAGLNALTEWYDHFSPTRGDDVDNSRALKAIMDPAFKDQALRLMMAEV